MFSSKKDNIGNYDVGIYETALLRSSSLMIGQCLFYVKMSNYIVCPVEIAGKSTELELS